MSNVSKSSMRDLYMDIPKESYSYIAERMSWGNRFTIVSVLSGRTKLSLFKFELIRDYLEDWKRHKAFSVANHSGCFDVWQHSAYYKGLTSLINSEEYMLLSNKQRSAIVKEQAIISNQIQSYTKTTI